MTDHLNGRSGQPDFDQKINNLKLRDEILQVMYWMTGEGLGSEFSIADLQKFLPREQAILTQDIQLMVSSGLLKSVKSNTFALTAQGQLEGGRRFADEFESMIKPGHFECDEPDCDCHNPESTEACKHLSPANTTMDG